MKDELIDLLEPAIKGMGFDLIELEYSAGGNLLRVFIDVERGVTVDDCEAVSRQISGILDVEDPIPGRYTLEVSSPGVDRPLRTLEHFRHFSGERVRIQLDGPFEGRRRFKGHLLGVEDEMVQVQVDDNIFELPFERIEKARLAPKQ
ncbi:ribosome maturation factor RimP [Natronospira proteinivora]|uniref:Ribosome maturation factor RimP n=1 Tax=Natronospira proteinivora TaxID=1807133 RepID=A0ABT1G7P8_9GAMM|nr:ribosome maturation factor RimP [Natronospira proteinivora]MCP1726970.1 ribosome maturation factor RimP [Natronospira proteinivora]